MKQKGPKVHLMSRSSMNDGLDEDPQVFSGLPGLVPLQADSQAGRARFVERDLVHQLLPAILYHLTARLLAFLKGRRQKAAIKIEGRFQNKTKRRRMEPELCGCGRRLFYFFKWKAKTVYTSIWKTKGEAKKKQDGGAEEDSKQTHVAVHLFTFYFADFRLLFLQIYHFLLKFLGEHLMKQ